MKVVQINTFPYKATGTIMLGIHKLLTEQGEDSYVVWGRGREAENDHEIVINDNIGMKFHGAYTRLTDKAGFASKRATKKLITKLEEISPDIIHLHNIHGYYINIEMLFNHIRSNKIKLVWTLHDCWALTGHCAWFDVVGCEKWKTGCHDCEQKKTYPASMLMDASKWNWEKKKELFTGLDATIVTPCMWLEKLVKQSYLKGYLVQVIYNGIDLDTFKPTKSNVQEKYGLDDRPIILGVASEWTERKGLKDFIALSELMPEVRFVVVGVTEDQLSELPETVKGIKRTNSQQELAELYSAATLFFNPTYEDNFPTTNLEALACGTPVVTYDTGGSPEAVNIGNQSVGMMTGKVINKLTSSTVDINKVKEELTEMINYVRTPQNLVGGGTANSIISGNCSEYRTEPDIELACRRAAMSFDRNTRLAQYLPLYEEVLR